MALASAWPTSPNATWQRCSTTGRPPITTWVTSAAVAANTTWSMRSSGRAPASRGEPRSRVAKSARAPVWRRPASRQPIAAMPPVVAAASSAAGRWWPRRPEARRSSNSKARDSSNRSMTAWLSLPTHNGLPAVAHAAAVGQGRGRQSGDRQALVVLGALLGQVQVQRRGPLRRPGRDLPHGARVQRPHAVDAGGDPQGRASLELPDPLGPGGGVAVAEAQLRAFERATLEVAPEVAGVDQGETDARLRSRGRQGEAHLVRVGVAPALLVVVDVVEFADRGDARERHLRVDSGRQRQVALRVEPACQLVHPPSPAPEVPSLPLGSAPQRAVEGVRVGIGEPGECESRQTGGGRGRVGVWRQGADALTLDLDQHARDHPGGQQSQLRVPERLRGHVSPVPRPIALPRARRSGARTRHAADSSAKAYLGTLPCAVKADGGTASDGVGSTACAARLTVTWFSSCVPEAT